MMEKDTNVESKYKWLCLCPPAAQNNTLDKSLRCSVSVSLLVYQW